MKSIFCACLFLAIQWITITNAGVCHRVFEKTFQRCCRLDKYFTTQTIDECAAKCIEYNRNKDSDDKPCAMVNLNNGNKECSLLYKYDFPSGTRPEPAASSETTSAELYDCAGGPTTTTTTPKPTTPTTRPPPPPSGSIGCGIQPSQFQPAFSNLRIIGGDHARPHSWPWQVSLRYTSGWHFCGGTILRVRDGLEESDIVLTAAHCIPVENGAIGDLSRMVVVAGTQAGSYGTTPGEERRRIATVHIHQNYANLVNDIAIIKLDKPISFSDKIRPICLPKESEEPPTKRTCVAIGWGRNESNSQATPGQLKQLISPVYSIESCQSRWYWHWQHWTYAFICSGPQDGKGAICNGDSGGPLMCKYEDGSWVQHGISSFVVAPACADPYRPPVFARVSTYVPWIKQKINTLSSLVKQ